MKNTKKQKTPNNFGKNEDEENDDKRRISF